MFVNVVRVSPRYSVKDCPFWQGIFRHFLLPHVDAQAFSQWRSVALEVRPSAAAQAAAHAVLPALAQPPATVIPPKPQPASTEVLPGSAMRSGLMSRRGRADLRMPSLSDGICFSRKREGEANFQHGEVGGEEAPVSKAKRPRVPKPDDDMALAKKYFAEKGLTHWESQSIHRKNACVKGMHFCPGGGFVQLQHDFLKGKEITCRSCKQHLGNHGLQRSAFMEWLEAAKLEAAQDEHFDAVSVKEEPQALEGFAKLEQKKEEWEEALEGVVEREPGVTMVKLEPVTNVIEEAMKLAPVIGLLPRGYDGKAYPAVCNICLKGKKTGALHRLELFREGGHAVQGLVVLSVRA